LQIEKPGIPALANAEWGRRNKKPNRREPGGRRGPESKPDIQIPGSKQIPIPKFKIRNSLQYLFRLNLADWNLFGIWCLSFGILIFCGLGVLRIPGGCGDGYNFLE
jgi:hypothetical protein